MDHAYASWFKTLKPDVINIETQVVRGGRVQRPEDEFLTKASAKLKFLREEREQKELCKKRKREKAIDIIEEHLIKLSKLTPTAAEIMDAIEMVEQ